MVARSIIMRKTLRETDGMHMMTRENWKIEIEDIDGEGPGRVSFVNDLGLYNVSIYASK